MKPYYSILFYVLLQFGCAPMKAVTAEQSQVPDNRELASATPTQCGAINEVSLEKPTDFTQLPLKFKTLKTEVFKTHCGSCHFGTGAYLPNLNDYQSTISYINFQNPMDSKLIRAIRNAKMPPAYNLQTREYEAYRFLEKWIKAGAPK